MARGVTLSMMGAAQGDQTKEEVVGNHTMSRKWWWHGGLRDARNGIVLGVNVMLVCEGGWIGYPWTFRTLFFGASIELHCVRIDFRTFR